MSTLADLSRVAWETQQNLLLLDVTTIADDPLMTASARERITGFTGQLRTFADDLERALAAHDLLDEVTP